MSSSFSLVLVERPFESLGRHASRSGRQFKDFVVDSEPLHAVLLRSHRGPLAEDLIPVLVADWPIEDDLDALLGIAPFELPDGRVPLYVCPECGDLGCGGVTAVIERDGESVIWRDLLFQNNYEPLDDEQLFDDVGPFAFNQAEYESTLETFRAGWAADAAVRRTAAKHERDSKRWFPFRLFGRRSRVEGGL